MTVTELFDIWINFKKIEVKKPTISTYVRKFDAYIMPSLGCLNLEELTITCISSFIYELMNTLSSKSVIDIKTILQSILAFAYKQNFIDRKIEIPAPPHIRKNIETFSNAEQRKLIEYIQSNMNNRYFLVLLGLGTGMRIGELCALKYKDIKKICNIRYTVQRIKNLETDNPKTVLHIGSPKSRLSVRQVPLNNYMIDSFRGIYDKKLDNCYILTGTTECSEPRNLERVYEKLLCECSIEYKKFHTLRHTFATNALIAGMDIKTLAEIMGLSVKVLISTYIHTNIEQKIKSMEKLKMA